MVLSLTRRTFAGRDVGIAFGALVALELLMYLSAVRFLQLPGYLVTVGYNYVQNILLPGIVAASWPVGYVAYLYGIALVLAVTYRGLRRVTGNE